jgi:hypothetical protein
MSRPKKFRSRYVGIRLTDGLSHEVINIKLQEEVGLTDLINELLYTFIADRDFQRLIINKIKDNPPTKS